MVSLASRRILALPFLSAASVWLPRTRRRRPPKQNCWSPRRRRVATPPDVPATPSGCTIPRPRLAIPMILLVGNYPLDRQQSMQRFPTMMLEGLAAAGVPAALIQPQPFFGNFRAAGGFVAKWLGYIDKFIFFRRQLWKKIAERPVIVHICDHSNAMYAKWIREVPVVVTCHDLLAVRGA